MKKEKLDYRFIDRKRHSKRACGYCHSKLHKGLLTVALLKKHKCLQKHCDCLQQYPEHPFWAQREKSQQMRKERKERYKDGTGTVKKS